MKVAALTAVTLALLGGHVQAAVVGYVQTPQGRIEVHDDRGPCAGDAKRADYIPTGRGAERVSGCWVIRGTMVAVVFLDGDVAQVPVFVLQKPEPA